MPTARGMPQPFSRTLRGQAFTDEGGGKCGRDPASEGNGDERKLKRPKFSKSASDRHTRLACLILPYFSSMADRRGLKRTREIRSANKTSRNSRTATAKPRRRCPSSCDQPRSTIAEGFLPTEAQNSHRTDTSKQQNEQRDWHIRKTQQIVAAAPSSAKKPSLPGGPASVPIASQRMSSAYCPLLWNE